MKTFLILCLALAGCFSAFAQDGLFREIVLRKDGTLIWKTGNELPNTNFEVYENYSNKWDLLTTIRGNRPDNTYHFKADTACGVFRLKIIVKGEKISSGEIIYSNPIKVEMLSPKRVQNKVELSRRTKFQVYDSYGNLKRKGCDKIIDVSELPKGLYYIAFAEKSGEFFLN